MSDRSRRYSESEMEEIFRRATEVAEESRGRSTPGREGLTLGQIQEIGREVGVPAERIEAAARSLERTPASPPRRKRFFGMPIGVGRTVQLPRRLDDDEWHRLVADLRETFDARGKVHEEGRFREWRNGNLRAALEPSASGERLRLRTEKGSARPGIGVGAGLLGGGVLFALLDVLTGGEMGRDPESMTTLILVGAVFLAVNLFQLPRWARTRERQMEEVADRVRRWVEGPGDESGGSRSRIQPRAAEADTDERPSGPQPA